MERKDFISGQPFEYSRYGEKKYYEFRKAERSSYSPKTVVSGSIHRLCFNRDGKHLMSLDSYECNVENVGSKKARCFNFVFDKKVTYMLPLAQLKPVTISSEGMLVV